MLNLFTGGDEAAGPAEDLRVVSLIDRGVLEAQNLNAEPAVQVSMYRTLGGIYQKLGNLTKAESLLQTSLDRRRAIFGADHPEVAEEPRRHGTAARRAGEAGRGANGSCAKGSR